MSTPVEVDGNSSTYFPLRSSQGFQAVESNNVSFFPEHTTHLAEHTIPHASNAWTLSSNVVQSNFSAQSQMSHPRLLMFGTPAASSSTVLPAHGNSSNNTLSRISISREQNSVPDETSTRPRFLTIRPHATQRTTQTDILASPESEMNTRAFSPRADATQLFQPSYTQGNAERHSNAPSSPMVTSLETRD